MTNKLRGFTLAEVLITLGLIGVVAILVMPALLTSVETAKVETAVSKAVNTMKNANMHMALDNDSREVTSSINGDTYIKELAPYIKGAKLSNASYTINGTASSCYVLSSDDNITYISTKTGGTPVKSTATNPTDDYSRRFLGEAMEIVVDVDGSKGANLYGRDQFVFLVDGYGEVIPMGGIDYNNFNSNSGMDSSTPPSWKTTCPSGKKITPTTPSDCTASLVENGYKINYGFRQIVSK